MGLPQAFLSLLTGLTTATLTITRTVGLPTVIRALYTLSRAINTLPTGSSLRVFHLYRRMREISPGLNHLVIRTILDCMPLTNWSAVLIVPRFLRNIFNGVIFPL